MSHTDPVIVAESDKLDNNTTSTGLHDDRYVIDELRDQIKKHDKHFGSIATWFEDQDKKIKAHESELQQLREDNIEFRRKLGHYAVTEHGEVPLLSDLTYIRSQVFYTPNLSSADRKTKSVWSLRLSVDVLNHRLLEEINVRLFKMKDFRLRYKKLPNRKQQILHECERLIENGHGDNTWAGCIQTFSRGGGRPYNPAQVAFLIDHEEDTSPKATQAHLHFLLDDVRIDFGSPRPSAGEKAGSSLWYMEWRPPT